MLSGTIFRAIKGISVSDLVSLTTFVLPCRHVSIYQRLQPCPQHLGHVYPFGRHRDKSHLAQLHRRILNAPFAKGDSNHLTQFEVKALRYGAAFPENLPPIWSSLPEQNIPAISIDVYLITFNELSKFFHIIYYSTKIIM